MTAHPNARTCAFEVTIAPFASTLMGLWALSEPAKVPKRLRDELVRGDHEVFVSAASTWEIAIKAAIGKVDAELDEIVAACETTGFTELPIRMTHTIRVGGLPPHHRDPFDRLLVAQCLDEGLTLVTRDPVFDQYPVSTIWR